MVEDEEANLIADFIQFIVHISFLVSFDDVFRFNSYLMKNMVRQGPTQQLLSKDECLDELLNQTLAHIAEYSIPNSKVELRNTCEVTTQIHQAIGIC